MKLFDFVLARNGTVELKAIDARGFPASRSTVSRSTFRWAFTLGF